MDRGRRNERHAAVSRRRQLIVAWTAVLLLAAAILFGVLYIGGALRTETADSETSAAPAEEGMKARAASGDLERPKGPPHRDDDETRRVRKKLQRLMEQFPTGSYWNHMGMELEEGEPSWDIVTEIPCDHSVYDDAYCNRYDGATLEYFPEYDYLTQCLGFSSMLSDQLFGEDAPIREYWGYENIRIGDQIRYRESWHSMVVYDVKDDFILVAEADRDYTSCEISWGRKITFDALNEHEEELMFLTRYEEEKAASSQP